jgi:hypothetical protein
MADYSVVERIEFGGRLFAILVRAWYDQPGLNFLTENDQPMQLAYMRHPTGKRIESHVHLPHERTVKQTAETLLLRKGRLLVTFYEEDGTKLDSRILHQGDVILLLQGGHGFEVLEEVEMFEVKQGPYVFELDKKVLKL